MKPALRDCMGLINDVIDDISPFIADDDDAAELAGILQDTHFLVGSFHKQVIKGIFTDFWVAQAPYFCCIHG